MKKIQKNQKGFTLIEIMVAVSLFVVVMMIAIGAIFSIVGANRKARNLNVVINNLNFAFESMIRDLRTGSAYTVPLSCGSSACEEISFVDREERDVRYYLEDGLIKKEYPNDSSLAQGPVTDEEVTIDDLSFILKGVGPDDQQLFLVIHIRGEVGTDKAKTAFNIETAVSPKELDADDL